MHVVDRVQAILAAVLVLLGVVWLRESLSPCGGSSRHPVVLPLPDEPPLLPVMAEAEQLALGGGRPGASWNSGPAILSDLLPPQHSAQTGTGTRMVGQAEGNTAAASAPRKVVEWSADIYFTRDDSASQQGLFDVRAGWYKEKRVITSPEGRKSVVSEWELYFSMSGMALLCAVGTLLLVALILLYSQEDGEVEGDGFDEGLEAEAGFERLAEVLKVAPGAKGEQDGAGAPGSLKTQLLA